MNRVDDMEMNGINRKEEEKGMRVILWIWEVVWISDKECLDCEIGIVNCFIWLTGENDV